MAGMKAGHRALDVCCGTGGLVLHCAGLGVTATGIDWDPRTLKVAEKRRRKRGLWNAAFQTANALYLPFEDDSFDHASVSMSVHEKERGQRDGVISEMRRVVKVRGSLVFVDYMAPLPRLPSSCAARLVEFLAGREHNECFKDYLEQGGLKGLLKRNHLHGEMRSALPPVEIVMAKVAA